LVNRQAPFAQGCLKGCQIPLNGQLSLLQICTDTASFRAGMLIATERLARSDLSSKTCIDCGLM